MILKQNKIREALNGENEFEEDQLWIVPPPSSEELNDPGSSSVDLRLGRWFLRLRQTRSPLLQISKQEGDAASEAGLAERQFVPFGDSFYLHPGSFVLGATLEWIKIPEQCTASIVGKSSWGRRGLIIETAPTVHPGFSGCLTLEITNVGEVPIELIPGIRICQLVVQKSEGTSASASSFDLMRRPTLGTIKLDRIARALGPKPNKD